MGKRQRQYPCTPYRCWRPYLYRCRENTESGRTAAMECQHTNGKNRTCADHGPHRQPCQGHVYELHRARHLATTAPVRLWHLICKRYAGYAQCGWDDQRKTSHQEPKERHGGICGLRPRPHRRRTHARGECPRPSPRHPPCPFLPQFQRRNHPQLLSA